MRARRIIEGEVKRFQKSMQPRPIVPVKLMWSEIERVGRVLAMGPVSKRKGDDRYVDCGLFVYYEMCQPDGSWVPDPTTVDGAPGAAQAFYGPNGSVREEWIGERTRWRGLVRTYEWPRLRESRPLQRFRKGMKPATLVAVEGSHGNVTAFEDGTVHSVNLDDPLDPESGGYAAIARFDFDEWLRYYKQASLPQSIDILDVGFYTKDGVYEPADFDWRTGHGGRGENRGLE